MRYLLPLLGLSLITFISCSDNSSGNSNDEIIEWGSFIYEGGSFGDQSVDFDFSLTVNNGDIEGDGYVVYFSSYGEEEIRDSLGVNVSGTRTDNSVSVLGVTQNGGADIFSFEGTLGTNDFDEQVYIGDVVIYTTDTPQDTLTFGPTDFPY